MAPEVTPSTAPAREATVRRRFCRVRFAGWLATSLAAALLAGSVTLVKASAPHQQLVMVSASSAGLPLVHTAPSKARSADILDSIREDVDPPPPAPPPPPPPPPPAPVAEPAPVLVRNMLISADGTLHTGVGIYSDCSGKSALTHAQAAIDTCVTDVTYFVGHNPGVFTPLLHMGAGSVITWYDNNATAHRLVIVATRSWQSRNGIPPPARGGVAAQFQTCLVPDGSVDEILDAVAA